MPSPYDGRAAVCVVVTGMHRSATSLVASLLDAAGLPMGTDLLGAELGNEQGHFEDRAFLDFHQRALLARGRLPVMGGDFAFAPTVGELAEAEELVAARSAGGPWGFKDPRASLFLDFWQQQLPQARFLLLYRHPLDVLASLVRRREPLPDLTMGLAAWQLYNQRILAFRQQQRDHTLLVHCHAAIDRPAELSAGVTRLTGLSLQVRAAHAQRFEAAAFQRLDPDTAIAARFAQLFAELQSLYDELEATADLPAGVSGATRSPGGASAASRATAGPAHPTSLRPAKSGPADRQLALIELMAALDGDALAGAMEQTGRLLARLLVEHFGRRRDDQLAPPQPPAKGSDASWMAAQREQLLERLVSPAAASPATHETVLVSVIVVNFNGESLLSRCLDCLLQQTHQPLEILVVDNGSTDRSLALLEGYAAKGKIRVIRSSTNRGCAGGRNLGIRRAKGEVIAFVDNDGFAHPRWLAEALAVLADDDTVGAVAPLVFFARRPLILNGAGGRLNEQGYGCDVLTKVPLEFSSLPHEVLYPMGCGMVVRREVLRRGGRLDGALLNYYDDVELGIRTWKLGYRVVVAPRSWVDHEFGSSGGDGSKAGLCERGRIRTALKYYPLSRLGRWLWRELRYRSWYAGSPATFRSSWRWNLRHLGSALFWRLRFAAARGSFDHLVSATWGLHPPPIPANEAFHPNLEGSGPRVVLDGQGDEAHLNYGWYYAERDGPIPYRWSGAHASLLLRTIAPTSRLAVDFCLPFHHQSQVLVRPWGSLDQVYMAPLEPIARSWGWTSRELPCALPPGDYEIVVGSDGEHVDPWGRSLGVAISRVEAA